MKKFKFSLNSLLEYRKRLEQGCQRELLEHMDALKRAKEALETCRLQFETCESIFLKKQSEGIEGREIPLYSYYLKRTGATMRKLEKTADHVRIEVDQKRADLVEHARKRMMMEKLRDRALTEHKKAEAKEENKRIDEISVLKYRRDS